MKNGKLKKTEALDKNGKVWDKESIQNLLKTNDNAVIAALLRIYARQTESEKIDKATEDYNTIGFTGVDAEILSSFVEYYQKWGKLSPKQMAITRNKIKKYWRQLLDEMRIKYSQVVREVN